MPLTHYIGNWKYIHLYAVLLGLLIGHSLILLNTLITGTPIGLFYAGLELWCCVCISLCILWASRALFHWWAPHTFTSHKSIVLFYLIFLLASLLGTEWAIFTFRVLTKGLVFGAHRNLLLLNAVVWTFLVAPSIWLYEGKKSNFFASQSSQQADVVSLYQLTKQAKLKAIQTKINPHFLYNALNSIAELITVDGVRAEEMTLKLAQLYEYTAQDENNQWISIAEELHIAKNYLEIERIRFGNLFSYEVSCDSDLHALLIPRFLLQPLLENSIKHGFAHSKGLVQIKLHIRQKELALHIEVFDTGNLFPKVITAGYGLRSTDSRLALHYGNKYEIKLVNRPSKCVSISFPITPQT